MKKLFIVFALSQQLFISYARFSFIKSLRSAFFILFLTLSCSLAGFAQQSGIAVGTDAPAFDPVHVSGPDNGTKACPMCKYGTKTDGLMIWINDDLQQYEQLISFLEAQYLTRDAKQWKTFIMYMNPKHEDSKALKEKLTNFSEKLALKNVVLTFIDSPTDENTAGVYKINSKVNNTIFAYKKRVISKKFINFDSQNNDFSQLLSF